jgi:hypothetical protein
LYVLAGKGGDPLRIDHDTALAATNYAMEYVLMSEGEYIFT